MSQTVQQLFFRQAAWTARRDRAFLILAAAILLGAASCAPATQSEAAPADHGPGSGLPLDLSRLDWTAARGYAADPGLCPLLPEDAVELSFDDRLWRRIKRPPFSLPAEFATPPGDDALGFTACTRFTLNAQEIESIHPALFLVGVGAGWKLFVNGRLVRDELYLTPDGQRLAVTRTLMGVHVPLDRSDLRTGENTVLFYLAGYPPLYKGHKPATPGLFFSNGYILADEADVRELRREEIWLSNLFIYLFFALYHVVLFLGRRRERYLLTFALSCVAIFVYFFSRSFYAYEHILETSFLTRIENSAMCLVGPLLMAFLKDYFYTNSRSPWILRGYYWVFGVAAALFLAIPFRWVDAVSSWLLFAQAPMVLGYAPYFIFRIAQSRLRDARAVATAMVIFLITAAWDLVNTIFALVSMSPLFQYGFFALILFLVALQALRYNRLHRETDRLNQELDRKNTALLALDRLKDEFLANTSHELKTPLHGIIGIAESMMRGAAGPVSPAASENLSLIATSGRRLATLINDIMDMSRLKQGELPLEIKPADLRSACSIAISILQPLTEGKSLVMENRIPANAPLVLADENRLLQIFQNLLANAIKFTDSGVIRVRAERRGNFEEIMVEDTGPGIPADRLADIFQPFTQADASESRPFGGVGLGLSITRKLVELQGGSIRAESQQGVGSRFIFALPIARNVAAADREPLLANVAAPTPPLLEAARAAAEAAGVQSAGPVILVADDEAVNLKILSNILINAGYSVKTALSGQEALDIALGPEPPDAAILDVMMPGVTGYEALRRIREKHSLVELPVLIVTARGRESDISMAFDEQANDYLTKPFHSEELLARLNQCLQLKKAAEERSQLRALQQDLRIAQKIQESILPSTTPNIRGLKISALHRQMSHVGGDFYDFHVLDEARLGILSADISGHGASAAIIGAMLKISFSIEEAYANEPDRLMARLNRSMYGRCENHFITGAYAYFDLYTRRMIYANAGHTPLLVWRERLQRVDSIEARGLPLGVSPRIECEIRESALEPGDRFLFFTDGITEARNNAGVFFGEEGLAQLLATRRQAPLDQFVHEVEAELVQWIRPRTQLEDDISLIAIDVL